MSTGKTFRMPGSPLSLLPRRGGRRVVAGLAALWLASPALAADDASSCAEGIAMIRDALANNPPETASPKLKKALKNAQREQREGEFDECLDAVADARRALGR